MITLSLGSACQVAHQLNRLGLRRETMFYDWLVTHHARLLETLPLNFEERLFREGYALPPVGSYLVENVTRLSFYSHDFPGLAEKDRKLTNDEVEVVREKYVRRAKRTREVLSSGTDIRIVRHFFAEPVENIAQQQEQLVSTLSALYPETSFTYLWGSDFNADHLQSPFGYVHHFPKAETWLGNDQAWDRALASITPR
ncbi:DUF1796 family putative cysteine peptidase [Ensifer canadensis]|uniref:DUF1796 family putative cysteine peptidase n=1 Tax=Ensifer canadensis TaxID=555315 RepID=UPI0035E3F2AB